MSSPSAIKSGLQNFLSTFEPTLVKSKESESSVEFYGTKRVMQGRQMVDGHYFASLVIKPKDLRFYFFPIYTHRLKFGELSTELQKALKGKSCFHFNAWNQALEKEVQNMIRTGVTTYQKEGII